jgi:hypothetical protein
MAAVMSIGYSVCYELHPQLAMVAVGDIGRVANSGDCGGLR